MPRPARRRPSSTSRRRRLSTGRTRSILHSLEATHEAIWMSERDGWNHLYLYDTATGKVKNQITQGRVGRAGRRSGGRGEAADLVSGGRHRTRAGSVLYPLLPRQFRRHRPDRAHGRRRHAYGHYSPDGSYLRGHLLARGSAAGDGTAPRRGRQARCCDLEQRRRHRAARDRLALPGAVRREGPRRQDRHLRRDRPALRTSIRSANIR